MTTHRGPSKALLTVLEEALQRAGLPEVELSARTSSRGVARFARTELDQGAVFEEKLVRARVARAGRVGAATTSDLDPDGIAQAIRDADEAARHCPILAGFPGFAPSSPEPAEVDRETEATAAAAPEDRARQVNRLFERVRARGLEAAGLLETSRTEHAVATTAGARKHSTSTVAKARFFVSSADASGYAGAMQKDVGALGLDELAALAIERCERGARPVALSPGPHDVILEPEAVAELLEWFAAASLGARELDEGSSALAGRIGQRITGAWVDLADDARDPSPLGFGVPFDAEGTNRSRVELLGSGHARAVVTDRLHAARAGRPSTGHAAPIGADTGPAPTAMWLTGGTARAADLPGLLGRGVYVTRFHYVNGLLDPRRALMTGMTRDGTFLVDKGRLGQGLSNTRFTESLLDALERTEVASLERRAVPTWWSDGGAHVVPALLVRGFRFTGESAP